MRSSISNRMYAESLGECSLAEYYSARKWNRNPSWDRPAQSKFQREERRKDHSGIRDHEESRATAGNLTIKTVIHFSVFLVRPQGPAQSLSPNNLIQSDASKSITYIVVAYRLWILKRKPQFRKQENFSGKWQVKSWLRLSYRLDKSGLGCRWKPEPITRLRGAWLQWSGSLLFGSWCSSSRAHLEGIISGFARLSWQLWHWGTVPVLCSYFLVRPSAAHWKTHNVLFSSSRCAYWACAKLSKDGKDGWYFKNFNNGGEVGEVRGIFAASMAK